MSDHAYLPPSGSHAWQHCALWPKMNEQFPETEESEVAAEGTAAHWVGWEVLAARIPEAGSLTLTQRIVTEEMIEGGELLASTIRTMCTGGVYEFHIEEKLSCSMIAPNCFGTPDYWAFDLANMRLLVFDYKFGHRFVDEIWNPQLLCYLAGIVEYLEKKHNLNPADIDKQLQVSFTVVQPRCFYKNDPVRTHRFRFIDARPHLNGLRNAAEATTVKQPRATTNEHCGDCPGRHACPALQQSAYTSAEYSNQRNIVQLKPAAAALELKILTQALARLHARVEGLKEVTIANLKRGEHVPFYRIEQGYGRTVWNVPDAQVVALGTLFGKDLAKPGTVTPAQAKKLGIDETVIESYSFTPATSMKLVPQNDKDAARVFGRT
jgi:hypothetical protein